MNFLRIFEGVCAIVALGLAARMVRINEWEAAGTLTGAAVIYFINYAQRPKQ